MIAFNKVIKSIEVFVLRKSEEEFQSIGFVPYIEAESVCPGFISAGHTKEDETEVVTRVRIDAIESYELRIKYEKPE